MSLASVSVVLINWRGASDTVECLRSLKSLVYQGQVCVCVVDNASADGSVNAITVELFRLRYAESTERQRGLPDSRIAELRTFESSNCGVNEVIVVRNRQNLGFAAANNIGYTVIAARSDPRYVWFLNNDTVVAPDALSLLVMRMEQDPTIGVCGATLLHHAPPNRVQAYGGVAYSLATARGRHIGGGTEYFGSVDNAFIEKQLSYISGASMLVSREFLQQVGPMCEDYFLYCEEIDWAFRARGRFRLGVETAAVVYHKEGASIGTASEGRPPSLLSDFFEARNRLRFAFRYTPWFFPTVWIFLLVRSLKRLLNGHSGNARVMFSAMFGRRHPKASWFRRV